MIFRTLGLVMISATMIIGLSSQPAPSRAVSAAPIAQADDVFKIDAAHSTLNYRIRHLGVCNFWGRVNKPTGTFRIDDADLVGSFIRVTVEIRNMDAGDDGRDRFLTGPDFFNAREYPTASFESTTIRRQEDGSYKVDGQFTMHGVTHDVTAQLTDFAQRQTDRFGYRGGFECRLTVNRSDYGMDLFVQDGTLGDEVTIIAAIEGMIERAPQ